MFPHKKTRRTTLHSPDNKTPNQLDYILAPMRCKSSINKAQTRTLVLMTLHLKLKIKNQTKSNRIRFVLEKLKDASIAAEFEEKLATDSRRIISFMTISIQSLRTLARP